MADLVEHAATGVEHQLLEIEPSEQDQKMQWDKLKETGDEAKIFEVNTAPLKSWPELVGKSGEEAKKIIEADNPKLKVQIIPEDSFVTMDFRTNRVRIFVDADGLVAKTPNIG